MSDHKQQHLMNLVNGNLLRLFYLIMAIQQSERLTL